MKRWLVALILGSCVGRPTIVHATVQDTRSLPGAAGTRVEYVGKPPHDNEIVDAFVYEIPEQAAQGATRPRRFPSGTPKLNLDLRLKDMPRTGVTVHFEVLTANGLLEMAEGFVSIVRLTTLGVASMEFDLQPKSGSFPDGPYQLKLFMNGAPVAILNWSVGEP